ncbi:MAG: 50S ribosomal protein L6, partial [Chloroflexi bacterium]|nr:50S ribosomal protein L6 [Chloroflexota bacterium]
MSRIGRLPIPLPEGVQVTIQGHSVTVKGPKGELSRGFDPRINIELQDGKLVVTRANDQPKVRALHGLTRALL